MLIDLNIHWPQKNYQTSPSHNDIVKLKNTLVTLEELGYTHIALNYTLNHSDKIPSNQTINPINLDLLKEFQSRLKLYTRVTIIVDEPSQGQSISKLQNGFDIVSVLPISEKGLLLACNSLDIDLITFDYSKKLPTFLKQKTIGAAIKRGVKFEITYSNFLKNENRPQFINNTLNLIRASRNQNLVVSSGAQQSVELRSFPDVLNLLQLLNFKQSDGNNLIDKASKVLLNGRLRIKSYKQTVMIGEDVVEEDKDLNKRNINEINGGDVFKAHFKKLKRNE